MRFLKIIRNKYFITVVGLLVWILFFDKNDVFTQYELVAKCNKLEKDRDYYVQEIEHNRKSLQMLKTDKKHVERIAREKYYMKKDNEDVYVFVTH